MEFIQILDRMEMSVLDFIDWTEENVFITVSSSDTCALENDFSKRKLAYRHQCDLSLPNNLMVLKRYKSKAAFTLGAKADLPVNEQLHDTFVLHDITNLLKIMSWFVLFLFVQILRQKKNEPGTFFCIFRNDLRVFETYTRPASSEKSFLSLALIQLKNKFRYFMYFKSLFLVMEKK